MRCGLFHSIKLQEYLPCMRTQVEGSRMLPRGWLIGNVFFFFSFKTKSLVFTMTMIKWTQPEHPFFFFHEASSLVAITRICDSGPVRPVTSGSERGWDNSQGI